MESMYKFPFKCSTSCWMILAGHPIVLQVIGWASISRAEISISLARGTNAEYPSTLKQPSRNANSVESIILTWGLMKTLGGTSAMPIRFNSLSVHPWSFNSLMCCPVYSIAITWSPTPICGAEIPWPFDFLITLNNRSTICLNSGEWIVEMSTASACSRKIGSPTWRACKLSIFKRVLSELGSHFETRRHLRWSPP